MKLFITTAFALITFISSTRGQIIYFLTNNGKLVNLRDSADFIRIISKPDSGSTLFSVLEYYKNNQRKSIGKSISIEPIQYEGSCLSFYPNGHKKELSNYKKGVKSGINYFFFPNGQLHLQTEYSSGNAQSPLDVNYRVISAFDSLGNRLVTKGSGHFRTFNDTFIYIEDEGNVKNGKREGRWSGTLKNLHAHFVEDYHNGNLIEGTYTDSTGKTNKYKGSRGSSPHFKGGLEGFNDYLSKNIKYPKYEKQHNMHGRVIISFIIEKDGKVGEAKVEKSVSDGFDQEALRVLKNSPNWVPGIMFGNPVKVPYSVPVDFILLPILR